MGYLAKYNPKNLLHMGTHKPSTAPPLSTLPARTLFLPAARTVQQAHLHSARTAAARTLVSQHAVNALARSQFIHSRHTIGAGGFACYFCPGSKTNYSEPGCFSYAQSGCREISVHFGIAGV